VKKPFFQRWRSLRIWIGAAVLLSTVIIFIGRDFGWLPHWPAWPASGQAGPLVLRFLGHPAGLTAVVAGIVILVTLLFGRVYCSMFCPLGIGQDLLGWILQKLRLRKRESRPLPSLRMVRYAVLMIVIGGVALGVALPLLLLDPYAITGRTLSLLFKPGLVAGNNLAVQTAGDGRFSALFPVAYVLPVWGVTAVAAGMLLLLALAVWRWGRIYCNSLCPVGAFLSLLSRISWYKLEFAPAACKHCRQCLNHCNAGCIDAATRTLDFDRCVLCGNCAAFCKFNGLHWTRRYFRPHLDLPERRPENSPAETVPISPGRRQFLAAAGTVAAGTVLLPSLHFQQQKPPAEFPIMPPGAGDFNRLAAACVGCYLCVENCPSKVIRPALLQYGAGGIMLPHLDFGASKCEFDCTACSNTCPTGALRPLTVAQKHVTQIGRVKYFADRCVVTQCQADCGACAEHCPTGAVVMKPWRDGLRIPVTDVSLCVGCGACEHVCPVRPLRSIVVEGLSRQGQAKPPVQTAPVQVKDNGFPF